MIEVLVSILVLAVGVLAAAGMQMTAIRTTQQTSIQSTALELVAEITEKMRSNPQVMGKPPADNPFLGIDFDATTSLGELNVPCNLATSNCTPEQLAAFDIHEWKGRMAEAMPAARAVICRDASPWDITKYSFKWTCDSAGSAYSIRPIVVKLGWPAKNPDGRLERDASDKGFLPQVVMVVAPYIK